MRPAVLLALLGLALLPGALSYEFDMIFVSRRAACEGSVLA